LFGKERIAVANPLVLTIDMGTQSGRALLCDAEGAMIAKAQKKYETPYYSLQPGWAEQSPAFYWDTICECCQQLKREQAPRWQDIIAVTVSTIRDSCVCLDEHMEPLRDIILWLDSRESGNLAFPRLQSLIANAAGLGPLVRRQRQMTHCNWIAEHEPGLWQKTKSFALFSGWINYKLSGHLADAIASVVGHVPFNNKKFAWMEPNELPRAIFDIRDDQLYDVVESGAVIGQITPKAAQETGIPAGLPLIATGSDKACETLGLGCIAPDQGALSFSTIATVEITTPRYMEPIPHMPAYCSILPGLYTPEVEIYRGYWLISWFKKEFAAKERAEAKQLGVSVEEVLNRKLETIPPGCDGLILHPYFTPAYIMPQAKGSVIGFADYHTREHLYRAIIEGVNFALMDNMRKIERCSKAPITQLFVAGGGSQSAEICQITANMFGLPLRRIHTHEVTGLGSSLVAFVSQGVYPSYQAAIDGMVHYQKAFEPDPAQAALYRTLYDEVFTKVFRKLEPIYANTNHLLKKH
jgi:sugar (pentulose or hexulose) kinase